MTFFLGLSVQPFKNEIKQGYVMNLRVPVSIIFLMETIMYYVVSLFNIAHTITHYVYLW